MKKKNWVLVAIILVSVLLIGMVIWIYAKRIERLENKMKNSTVSVHKKLSLYGPSRRK